MKKLFILLLLSWLCPELYAQHQELTEKPGLWKDKDITTDTTSLLSAFRRGQVSGHFRYFFMATNNKAGLSDYHAHAAGGGIRFETARFKNFQLGISGFFVFNIGSSNLALPDEATHQANRYETGLFDIEDPSNKNDIDRLEELFLKYHLKNATITAGRQLLNTPFINLQDGRMRPTEVEAIWTEINAGKKWKLQGGYIYGISPRSTVKWYKPASSIGVYPAGVNEQGTKSGYASYLTSRGILLAGITWQPTTRLKLQYWNQYTENIFNSAMLQAGYTHALSATSRLSADLQLIRQDALRNGGNDDPAKAYIKKGSKAWTFGARAGWKNERWDASLNYNRITAHGRYLMPREWGRDPFFTFLPRERNEGLGNVQALMARLNYKIPAWRLNASAAFGWYHLPAVTDFAMNKYGMPSYNQLNADLRYQFAGWLKGLETQILYVYKNKTGNSYGNDKYVINKVDMQNWNIVFNYQF